MSYDSVPEGRLKKKAFLKLLEIKDSDIRLMTLHQGKTAVDQGLHIGGAFSAIIPLVSLYYGEVLRYDAANPTSDGQDLFTLSKGHAVAALASVYADLGFFPESLLEKSRGFASILNGHPGPILPGVHTATGPLGQGICVAEGFALAAKRAGSRDVFCVTGDGELQEGVVWEAIMYSGTKRLDNLCVLIDKNEGQLDVTTQLTIPFGGLAGALENFGWRVFDVDATQYEPVLDALREFKYGPRTGRPTAIVCNSRKGWGGLSNVMEKHKIDLPTSLADQETALQEQRRARRVAELSSLADLLTDKKAKAALLDFICETAAGMNLSVSQQGTRAMKVEAGKRDAVAVRAAPRDKKIRFDPVKLPVIDSAKQHVASDVISACMKIYALDERVVSVDADLASTSGLEAGVSFVDATRALNVGIAEANMMCVGEAFAALGCNVWVSTFCPFFDWKVLRRIAVSYQERLEAMERSDGWLSAGHGLDLTFLATAPNLETKTNGATHMGNDDSLVFDGIAHLKIIDASCPRQVAAAVKWIMEGNRGLVYLRILRAGAPVLYGADFAFDYGKGYYLSRHAGDAAYIVSSGRGAYEALEASRLLESKGLPVGVIDMPSIDESLINELYETGKPVVVAEQNNGFIWTHLRKTLFKRPSIDTTRLVPINLLDDRGEARFLHSATYAELLEQYGLSPAKIAERVGGLCRRA